VSLAVAAAGAAALGLLLVGLWAADADVERLTRDPTTTAGVAASTGVFSTLGLLGWAAAAGACAVTAAVLREGRPRRFRFFAATAALIAVLAVDDALLIHDEVGPVKYGIPEELIYILLAGLVVTWAVWFREELLQSHTAVLAAAAAAFGISAVMDFLETGRVAVEDWLKFSGILALTVWCFAQALSVLSPASR
jgi:uncharacterized membrane protein